MPATPPSALPAAAFAISTARLRLALVSEDDAADYFPLMGDARLTRFLAWAPHPEPGQTRTVLASLVAARAADRGIHWAVRSQDGVLVGLVSLIDLRLRHLRWRLDRAELAYWIAPDHQGRGLATEAAGAVVRFGLRQLGLHKIIVAHAVGNGPSGGVARRLGFRSVGRFREAFEKDGEWHDLHYHELLSSELSDEDAR